MAELKYFISYSRTDSAFVLKLAKELRDAGVNLWLDQLDILGGERWDRAVEQALQTCQAMIAVLSPESVASDNVMDEINFALGKEKLVIPVIIESCEIPFRLRRLHYIDFTANYQTGFSQLLKALRIEQPPSPPPPPPGTGPQTWRQRLIWAVVGYGIGVVISSGLFLALGDFEIFFHKEYLLILFIFNLYMIIPGAIFALDKNIIYTAILGYLVGGIFGAILYQKDIFSLKWVVLSGIIGALGGAIVGVILKKRRPTS